MDILFLLIPLSVVLALLILAGLAWAVWRGQFDSLEAEGERILHGDRPESRVSPQPRETLQRQSDRGDFP